MDLWTRAHALLLAGGKGTRFWPLSREDHPKQLLRLFSDRPLVEETYLRIHTVLPSERIHIATSAALTTRLMAMFPDVPAQNFIVEPVPRNTAPCIAVAAQRCLARDPDAVLVVLPSDHYVADPAAFLDVLAAAIAHAQRGEVVTLGVTPTHPETGYGYIRFGEFVESDVLDSGGHDGTGSGMRARALDTPEHRHRARRIQAFVEKPDSETALSYLRAGRYLWNSGIFVFRADVMLDKVRRYLPDLAAAVEALALAGDAPAEAVSDIWARMPDISIDYGIMEKAEGLVVIPASFGWSDVGSWRALRAFPTDDRENFVHGRVVALESHGNVLYSTHGVLAALGLKNMVVVVTRGAVLVCPVERTQDVKALVAELKKRGLSELL